MRSAPPTFSSADARQIAGITQRQLDYWDQVGLVRPSIRRARGKGVERQFSYTDLVKLKVVQELRKAGISLQKIQRAIRVLKERNCDSDPLLDEMLITDGVKLNRVTSDPGALEDMLSQGQLSFSVVFLGRVETEMQRIISLRSRKRAVG